MKKRFWILDFRFWICILLFSAFCLLPIADCFAASDVPYGDLFRTYSKQWGFDWRLPAAQGWQESRFKADETSPVGAAGLMQIMPFNWKWLKITDPYDAKQSIKAGIYYDFILHNDFLKRGDTPPESLKKMLGAYNCGPGRIYDAEVVVANDSEIGCQPETPLPPWACVAAALYKLSRKMGTEYHQRIWNQPKPRYGFFEGADETTGYVTAIWRRYEYYKSIYK